MINICMTIKQSNYIDPPADEKTRWNWFDSEMIDWPDGTKSMGHRHPNGKGWVADTAYVSNSCIVNEKAVVFGEAKVFGKIEVLDKTEIYGSAIISGEGTVGNGSDQQKIYGASKVFGNNVWSSGTSEINGARVFGNITITGDTKLTSATDYYGKFTTKAGDKEQDIVYPNPPQLHGDVSQELVCK